MTVWVMVKLKIINRRKKLKKIFAFAFTFLFIQIFAFNICFSGENLATFGFQLSAYFLSLALWNFISRIVCKILNLNESQGEHSFRLKRKISRNSYQFFTSNILTNIYFNNVHKLALNSLPWMSSCVLLFCNLILLFLWLMFLILFLNLYAVRQTNKKY